MEILEKKTITNDKSRIISLLLWEQAHRGVKGGYVPLNLLQSRDVTIAELKRKIEKIKGIPTINQQLIKSCNVHMYRMLDKQTIALKNAHLHEQFILFDKTNNIAHIPSDLQQFCEVQRNSTSIK